MHSKKFSTAPLSYITPWLGAPSGIATVSLLNQYYANPLDLFSLKDTGLHVDYASYLYTLSVQWVHRLYEHKRGANIFSPM